MASMLASLPGADVVVETFQTLKRMNYRQLMMQAIQLGLIVTSALMIWKGLMLVTGSESPVVVVLSGSMEPGFQRGDILFLNMGKAPISTGEIVVFNINGRDIPIVHRVIKVHQRSGSDEFDVLTKITHGDNNYSDDRGLYAQGQEWLNKNHIMGRAVGLLPNVGIITILMNDYPYLKFALIGVLGLLVITNKEG
ncbi:hypothetical protein QJQ45_025893 [Haematococcus lacustris]|nr:hypothetical protein QJQ45_025893 [Haematococcus lacustris]